ncbi:hypothetical protein JYT11_01080, partial [Planctomycetaceae bacterium AH-315-I19]|nr:hypothetical protein [Planctomycetaceae bacterium AH-315-I19]
MRTIISFCAAMLFIITPAQAQLYQLKPELEAPASQALQLMQCKAASLVLPAQLGQPFTMSVPFESGSLTFEMAPHSVVTADYKYMRELVDGTLVEIAPGVERTYRGTCVEFPEAVVAGSLIRSGFKGRVIWPNGAQSDLLIEPIFGIIAGAIIGDHAIYKTSDLMNPIAGVCGTVGVGAPVESGVSGGAGAPGSLISVRLACDTDSEFVLYVAGLPPNLDGTSVTVESKIMAMVNQVNAIYEMSTEDGGLRITHAVSFIMKRESSILYDIDTGASDAGDELLNRVRTEWNPGGSPPTQNRDIVHLFSGKPPLDTAGAMGAIGLAAPATVCTDPLNAAGWSIGDLGPDSILVAAHELGHNWGADHCDPDCPGNIMNTTIINGANIFTDGSIAAIQEHINTANSMGGCFNIVASSIFPTSSIDSVIAMSGDLLAISSPARIVNPPAAGSVSIYRKI